jgi:hypothetical protein
MEFSTGRGSVSIITGQTPLGAPCSFRQAFEGTCPAQPLQGDIPIFNIGNEFGLYREAWVS